MAFYENYWNCPNCGQAHISALRKLKCPQCGHSKVSSSQEYMGNEITDPDGLELARGGPHWNCRFCGSVNLDKHEKCQDCGRNPDDKDEDMPIIEYGTNPPRENPKRPNQTSVVSTFPPLGERVPDAHQDASRYVNLAQPYYEKPKNRSYVFDLNLIPWEKVAAVAGLIVAIFLIWFIFFRTTPRNGTVSGFSWRRDIVIDRYQTVSEEGWSVPYGGRLTGSTSRIYDYTNVYSTRTVTDHRTCYRNRGNGSSESYDCSTTRQETYVSARIPNYRAYYFYDIDKFVYNRTIRATNADRSPFWPAYTLALEGTVQIGAERVSATWQLYTVQFTVYNQKEEKKVYALDTDEDAWSKYSTEEIYILKINSLGKILNDPYRDKLKADLKKTQDAVGK